jgi:RNA polymerase sigma factor (sigma-70 family)
MPEPRADFETSWSLIALAAEGDAAARARFCETYQPLVRAYLHERWRGSPLTPEVEDAAQEVFLECCKAASPLARAESHQGDGFRAYLIGIVRHVAQRFERRTARKPTPEALEAGDGEPPDRTTRLSQVLDRGWALMLVDEARRLMQRRAQEAGDTAQRRVDLLALRFTEGLPIRDIAVRWGTDAARLHHEYARAREEFAACLRAVVARHAVRTDVDIERECERVLAMFA